MWYISMYHVTDLKQTRCIKNVTLKRQKKFVGVAVYSFSETQGQLVGARNFSASFPGSLILPPPGASENLGTKLILSNVQREKRDIFTADIYYRNR